MKPTTKVLILGGGFGGVYTALRLDRTLARDPSVEVTIVSPENFLLFTPMLHEVAASDLAPSDNVAASLRDKPQAAFRFKMLGQLATIGQRAGVAQIMGFRFSGLLAWMMWRGIYLFKLPRLEKKLQVVLHWTMDLFFSRDMTQFVTAQSIRQASRHLDAADPVPARPASPEARPQV